MTWTPETMKQAADLWRQGKSAGQIAAALRMTRNAICGIADRNRDMFPRRGRGTQTSKLQPPHSRVNSPWTDDVLKRAAYRWAMGDPAGEIARECGVSEPAFQQLVSRMRDRFPKRRMISRPARSVEPAVPATPPPVFEEVPGGRGSSRDLGRFRLAGREPVAFVDLGASQCRFPFECLETVSGPSTPCCGADTGGPLASYCRSHRTVMDRSAA